MEFNATAYLENWENEISTGSNLLLISARKHKRTREELQNYTKALDLPHTVVHSKEIVDVHREVSNAYREYEPEAMTIIGDINEFPANYYRTIHGTHYTDTMFQDPENSGRFTTPVGRVFGSVETIFTHLLMKTGDSNKALAIIPSEEEFATLVLDGLDKLGLETTNVHGIVPEIREDLEDAELIMQLSNSRDPRKVIHGTLSGWTTIDRSIFSTEDLRDIRFRNYPIVFSQACVVGNHGSFVSQMLRSGALFLGSSSPTFSFMNFQNVEDWKTTPSSDGWKIGLLDLLDEKRNIGEIKIEIENIFSEYLLKKGRHREFFDNFRMNRLTKFDQLLSSVTPVIQYQLFGNPLRFSTVGIEADFDLY